MLIGVLVVVPCVGRKFGGNVLFVERRVATATNLLCVPQFVWGGCAETSPSDAAQLGFGRLGVEGPFQDAFGPDRISTHFCQL